MKSIDATNRWLTKGATLTAAAVALLIAACSSGDTPDTSASEGGAPPPPSNGQDGSAGCQKGRYKILSCPSYHTLVTRTDGTVICLGTPGIDAAVYCGEDGTGRVLDTKTGLTWMAKDYNPGSPPGQTQAQASAKCAGLGMRLPTKDEALGIAGYDNCTYCSGGCPFDCGWVTWTSSSAGPGLAWHVNVNGSQGSGGVDLNFGQVLCVQ